MKRFFILCFVYFLFLCIPIEAQSTSLKYQIYTSSQKENTLALKNHVLSVMDYLFEGLDEKSYSEIVKENLDMFQYEKDMKIQFKRNTLYIVEGDGKGSKVSGTYQKRNVCYEEVQPKSLLKEWWKNATDKE